MIDCGPSSIHKRNLFLNAWKFTLLKQFFSPYKKKGVFQKQSYFLNVRIFFFPMMYIFFYICLSCSDLTIKKNLSIYSYYAKLFRRLVSLKNSGMKRFFFDFQSLFITFLINFWLIMHRIFQKWSSDPLWIFSCFSVLFATFCMLAFKSLWGDLQVDTHICRDANRF